VFEDWPWWGTLSLSVGLGALAWAVARWNPDRRTYWEKQLHELEALAEHLWAVHQRDALPDPPQVSILNRFTETLDALGIPRPADGHLTGDLLYVWCRYLHLFIDRVKRKKASNLRPLAEELRIALNAEKDARIAFEKRIIGGAEEGGK